MRMRKFVLSPDSFKGTLSSQEVCAAMREGILRAVPEAEVRSVPVADGGEGSVDAFLCAVGGRKKELTVQGPFGEEVPAFYGILQDGATAVIEMAACAGLPLAAGRLDPERATTYGVGQLMLDAVDSGCKKLILCLGGSCTNDGGAGAAAAAGARFLRRDGSSFVPVGGTLEEAVEIELSGLQKNFAGVEIAAMCDIDNPLCGVSGAAAVFGPQKGADPAAVKRLDAGLLSLSRTVESRLGPALSEMPGAGAAGGMGFGMAAFFGAALKPGIETVLDAADFQGLLRDADLVLTGEGKLDSQSVRGKVISGVAKRAKAAGVPVAALAGQIGRGFEPLYDLGLSAAFSINRAPLPLAEAAPHTAENIALVTENLLRLLLAGRTFL